MKNYTEYDMHVAVRVLAAKLGVLVDVLSDEELFERIEEKCPEAAEIFLEKIFEKDKLKEYLQSAGRIPQNYVDIPIEGDSVLEKFFWDQDWLYFLLNESVADCLNQTATEALARQPS